MAALTPIDRMALDAFDELTSGGVDAWTRKGPFVIGFEQEKESRPFIHEIQQVEKAGQKVPLTRLDNPQLKVPQLSAGVSTVYEMEEQRFIEPGPFVQALADAVQARGGKILTGMEVRSLRHGPQGISVESYGQEPVDADVVVLATGAWLPALAKPLGVKTRVQAGRGYSFSVATDDPAEFPIYFPARRVACTPYQGRLRIAGTMEFRGPDEPLQTGRIDAILASVRPLFTNMDLENLEDIWVGVPSGHARRAAGGRRHPFPRGLRCRRPRHVGHCAGTGHRQTAGRADRHRAHSGRDPPLRPAPVTGSRQAPRPDQAGAVGRTSR